MNTPRGSYHVSPATYKVPIGEGPGVRFTEEQRERLATAGFLRGWTPTNLLRVAELEKAAYVVNTHVLLRASFSSGFPPLFHNFFCFRQ